MKKVFCVLFVILGCTVCSAQSHNDSESQNNNVSYFIRNWSGLVNYVCCRYTNVYIQAYIDNVRTGVSRPSQNIVKLYNSDLKGILNNQKINNSIDVDSLSVLLIKYEWNSLIEPFVLKFKDRLNISQENKNIDALLSLNTFSNDTRNWLKDEESRLRDEIISDATSSKKNEEEQSKKTPSNISKSPIPDNNPMPSTIWWLIILTVCVILLFVSVLVLSRIKANQAQLADFQRKLDSCSGGSNSSDQYNRLSMDINNLKDEIAKLKYEISVLKSRSAQESRPSNQNVGASSYRSPNNVSQPTATSTRQTQSPVNNEQPKEYIYLKPFNEGILKESSKSNPEALFRIEHVNGEDYKFEFDQVPDKVETALSSVNAYFDGICDMGGYSNNSKRIIMTQTGLVRKQSNGTWIVVQKGVVKFE